MGYDIGWGIIGCGGIAESRTIPEGILPAEGCSVEAVMSPHRSTVRRVGERFGVKSRYTGYEELLRDPGVDAVYIASPNHAHHAQVLAAAESGKHVLCEKPLGMNVNEVVEMISACEENGVKFAAGFMMRFHSCHVEAQRIIDEGTLGEVVFGRVHFGCWYPDMEGAWRQDPELGGGGSLMDLGIHGIDLLRMLMGDVSRVFAVNRTESFDYRVEDSSLVDMTFADGGTGMVESFFNMQHAGGANCLEVYGTKGYLRSTGSIGQASTGTLRYRTASGEDEELSPEPVNVYRAEIDDFRRAIEEDSEPFNSGIEGLKDQQVVMAAYESSKAGKTIDLLD
jgi:predicted dehydrogenase